MRPRLLLAALLTSSLAVLALWPVVFAQDKPRLGGELVFLVPSEPPSYDGHKEGTFGVVHPLAPHYNTLLRVIRSIGRAPRSCPISRSRGRSRPMASSTRSRFDPVCASTTAAP